MDAKKASEISKVSKLQVILDAIKEKSEKGGNFLELFDWWPGEFGGYVREYTYGDDEIQSLQGLGFKVKEITQKENMGGLFFNRDVRTYTYHSISW
jgi:hypothetical protein